MIDFLACLGFVDLKLRLQSKFHKVHDPLKKRVLRHDEVPPPLDFESHVFQDNSFEADSSAECYCNQEKQPLLKGDLPFVTPRHSFHLPCLLFGVNHNMYATHQERSLYPQIQLQSDLDLLQNRSVQESLLMKIVKGKDYV